MAAPYRDGARIIAIETRFDIELTIFNEQTLCP